MAMLPDEVQRVQAADAVSLSQYRRYLLGDVDEDDTSSQVLPLDEASQDMAGLFGLVANEWWRKAEQIPY